MPISSPSRRRYFPGRTRVFGRRCLPKRYGWGAHYDADGRIALYGVETEDYRRLTSQSGTKVVPAMRNRRP
jgi:hypothetical protein